MQGAGGARGGERMEQRPTSRGTGTDDADGASAPDPRWCLRQTAFDVASQGRDASLFALANGSLGVRGDFEEAAAPGAGCYLAGFYERHPIAFHERLPGFARNTDTRVPVGDGTRIAIALGDEMVDPAACEWLDFERVLDLRTGAVRRRSVLRTPQGATIGIDAERVVSADDDVLSIRFGVRAIDYDGTVTLISRLGAGQRAAAQGDDPRIGVAGDDSVDSTVVRADADAAILTQRTRRSGIALACAQTHRLAGDGLAFVDAAGDGDRASQRFRATLRSGDAVTLEKTVAYACADGTPDLAPLIARAAETAARASTDGHAAQATRRADALAAFWQGAGLAVDADPAIEQALRFNLFHLAQSASRSAAHGTAAKGLTGEGYEGHCFWDTEVFVLPVMALTAPPVARAMLGWRHRTLDAARANAREMNHATGALYPWRTIAGAECSAHYPSGSAAYHINADIAYAIGLYLDATDDVGFLLEAGAEMLFETARIWPQAGHFDPLRGGAFGIHGVTGPDEYTALVDNNFYTNRMAQRHLLRAVAVWERLSAQHPDALAALAARLALSQAEVDDWRRIAGAMQLPVDATLDLYAQDDTFLHKPRWDFAAHASDRALLLDCHPLTLYRHQVCKQADVVMALVLAGDGLDPDRKRRSFDYYEAITTHDSTLSPAIHGILASELGLDDAAQRYFDGALRIDLDDLHGNTGHGVHMAAMAGSWLALGWGFAGLRIVDGVPGFAPRLPSGWRGYRVGLQWRGRRLEIAVASDAVTYRLHGDALTIAHHGARVALSPDRETRVALHAPSATPAPRAAAFPRPCRALIFDLDGVLTDTAHVHYVAWKRLADEIGVPFDETVNRRLKGIDRMASLDILLERADRGYDAAEKSALAERKNGYYRDAIERFGPDDLFDGVRTLLADARHRGLRIALASASRNAGLLLERLGIADAFDVVVDAARIARAKPAPDIFLAAATALGIAPNACIGIEDAAAGVAAIRAAGMAAIGIGDAHELAAADAVLPAIGALRLDDFIASLPSPSVMAQPKPLHS
jgi:beta-phosphoglucomutase